MKEKGDSPRTSSKLSPKGDTPNPQGQESQSHGKRREKLPLQPAYPLACRRRGSPEYVFRLHSTFPCCLHNRDGPEPAVHLTVLLPNPCGRAYQEPFQSMLGFVLFLSYCAIYEGRMSILHAHPQCMKVLPRSSEPFEIVRHGNIAKIASSLVGTKGWGTELKHYALGHQLKAQEGERHQHKWEWSLYLPRQLFLHIHDCVIIQSSIYVRWLPWSFSFLTERSWRRSAQSSLLSCSLEKQNHTPHFPSLNHMIMDQTFELV